MNPRWLRTPIYVALLVAMVSVPLWSDQAHGDDQGDTWFPELDWTLEALPSDWYETSRLTGVRAILEPHTPTGYVLAHALSTCLPSATGPCLWIASWNPVEEAVGRPMSPAYLDLFSIASANASPVLEQRFVGSEIELRSRGV